MNRPPRSLIAQAIDTAVGILRLRKGPEDMPASGNLLLVAIVAAVLLRAALLAIPMPMGTEVNPALLIALSVGLVMAFVKVVLDIAGHPARFQQTMTAMFACEAVMAPALLAGRWLYSTYYETTSAMGALAGLPYYIADIWLFVAAVRILRSATEWPLLACVLLLFAAEMFITLVIVVFHPSVPSVGVPA